MIHQDDIASRLIRQTFETVNDCPKLQDVEDCDWSKLLLDGPDLVSEAGRWASFQLANAIGYCLLFGIDTRIDGDEHWTDGVLPTFATAMMPMFIDELDSMIQQADELETIADDTDDDERDELCFSILERRMRIWGVHEAVKLGITDEAKHLPNAEPKPVWLQQSLSNIAQKIAELDRILQHPHRMEIMSSVVHTPMLQNWRETLADKFVELFPWWLNYSLEDAAARLEQREVEFVSAILPIDASNLRPRLRLPGLDAIWRRIKKLFKPPGEYLLEFAAAPGEPSATELNDTGRLALVFDSANDPKSRATIELVVRRSEHQQELFVDVHLRLIPLHLSAWTKESFEEAIIGKEVSFLLYLTGVVTKIEDRFGCDFPPQPYEQFHEIIKIFQETHLPFVVDSTDWIPQPP